MEQPDTLILHFKFTFTFTFCFDGFMKKDNLIKNNLEFICLFGEKVLLFRMLL